MNSNWFAENKFLAGYLVIVLAAAAGLGFLVFQSVGRFAEVSEEFDRQATELRRLSELPLYPNAENEKRLKEQQAAYSAAIDDLTARFAKQQPPIEETSPDEFKTLLARGRDAFAVKAAEAGVKITENFHLGFGDYENNLPPDAKTATLLRRELHAVKIVLYKLVDLRVIAINGIARQALPGEGTSKAPSSATSPPPSAPGAGRKGAGRDEKPLIERYTFDVQFLADQSRFRDVLNSIATLPDYLIVRAINVDTSEKNGPARGDNQPAPAAGTPGEPQKLKFIVGMEQVNVTLRIELLVFRTEGGESK
jgi:hypothetical protein